MAAGRLAEENKLDDLIAVIENSSGQLVCFTGVSADRQELSVSACDGVSVWRSSYTAEQLRQRAEESSFTEYATKLRESFQSRELVSSNERGVLTLSCSRGSETGLGFELIECKAAETREAIQRLVLSLALRSQRLEQSLQRTQKLADSLKAKQNAAALDLSSAEKQSRAAPRQQGMSVINPTSRKRKIAKGIDWDGDD